MTTVVSGPIYSISANQTDRHDVVLADDTLYVVPQGQAFFTTLSGGEPVVESGGIASGRIVDDGGTEFVGNLGGGAAFNTIINSGFVSLA